MDVAGTAVGVVSLGIQVCKGLVDYYQSWKNCSKDIARMVHSAERLLVDLSNIEDAIKAETDRSGPGPMTDAVTANVESCKEAIDALKAELDKFKQFKPPKDLKTKIKSKARAFFYPFREGTMRDLEALISHARDALSPAISGVQLKATGRIQDETKEIHELLTLMNLRAERGGIRSWIQGLDPNDDLYTAREKWQPGTGEWFTRSNDFLKWSSKANSFLWLYGFGTTKTPSPCGRGKY